MWYMRTLTAMVFLYSPITFWFIDVHIVLHKYSLDPHVQDMSHTQNSMLTWVLQVIHRQHHQGA